MEVIVDADYTHAKKKKKKKKLLRSWNKSVSWFVCAVIH